MTKEHKHELNRILEKLKKAIPEAEEKAQELSDTGMQMAAKSGWLQGSIKCAIIELEILLGK